MQSSKNWLVVMVAMVLVGAVGCGGKDSVVAKTESVVTETEPVVTKTDLMERDVPIQSAFYPYFFNEGKLFVQVLDGTYYERNLDNVRIEKRLDGQSYTSAKFSTVGVTIFVPVDEDVYIWQKRLDEYKAKYAASRKPLEPQRVFPR